MAIQLFTLIKLSGKTGEAAFEYVRNWSKIEKECEARDKSCPKKIDSDSQKLLSNTKANFADASVLYFAELLDSWSVGSQQFAILPENASHCAVAVNIGRYSVAAYRLPDDGVLARTLEKRLKLKHVRYQGAETRRFAQMLLEAVRAMDKVAPEATILIFRESFTISFDDTEVKAAATIKAKWM